MCNLPTLSFRQEKKRKEKKKKKKEERIGDVYFPSHVLTNELHPPQKLIPVYHEITLEWCAPPRPVPRTRKTLNHFPSPAVLLSSFLGHRCRGWREESGGEEGLSDTHLCATSHRSSQPRPTELAGSRSSRCNAEPRDRIIRLSGVEHPPEHPGAPRPRFL